MAGLALAICIFAPLTPNAMAAPAAIHHSAVIPAQAGIRPGIGLAQKADLDRPRLRREHGLGWARRKPPKKSKAPAHTCTGALL